MIVSFKLWVWPLAGRVTSVVQPIASVRHLTLITYPHWNIDRIGLAL